MKLDKKIKQFILKIVDFYMKKILLILIIHDASEVYSNWLKFKHYLNHQNWFGVKKKIKINNKFDFI